MTRASFLLLSGLLLAACGGERMAHMQEVAEWRAWRLADVTAEDSWLTLIDYHWITGDSVVIGTGAEADIRLPRGPEVAGILTSGSGGFTFRPVGPVLARGDTVARPMPALDDDGTSVVFEFDDLNWFVRTFQDRPAVRVRDNRAPLRVAFPGLDYYPVNRTWRIDAYFEAYDPPKRFPVAIYTGGDAIEESPGRVVFDLDGRRYELDVTDTSDTQYFVIFADLTNADDTYPAGRYVWFDRPAGESGPVVLDFNKAYNPPCAFTEFATCPLPPRSHRIDARIEAGELRFETS